MQDSPLETFRQVGRRSARCKRVGECYKSVRQGRSATVLHKSWLDFYQIKSCLEDGVKSMYVAKEMIYPTQVAFIVPLGSPLSGALNPLIGAMHRAGLIEYWQSLYWPNEDKCNQQGGHGGGGGSMGGEETLTFEDLTMTFVGILVGAGIASFISMAERVLAAKKSIDPGVLFTVRSAHGQAIAVERSRANKQERRNIWKF